MGYINTRSSISKAEIDKLIGSLANVNTSKIDGGVLANMVRTCHECGLKKSELIDLSVGDVSRGGKVNDSMQVGDSKRSLSERAKGIIQDHIDYLKDKGYWRYSSSPLFPNRGKKRYASKSLDNHFNPQHSDLTLEKVRQAGICNHYNELKCQELPAQDCLKKTKAFACISIGQLKGILTGNIQQTGKKSPTGPDVDYLKQIDKVIGNSQPDIDKLEDIKADVIKDEVLDGELKRALVEALDRKLSDARNSFLKEKQDPDGLATSDQCSFREIIEKIKSPEVQSENDVDSGEELRSYFFGNDNK
jgi:hypothetical protein